nr:bifunctional DNA primase/polymerase [uncultured Dysosmobacter sp.]
MLKHAKYYASPMGLRVFPCWPMEKNPATTHGCKDATTDLEQIQKWWTGTYFYNIGIATGNGIVVLDVDINDQAGKYGDETLDELEKQCGPLPDTWMCLTGGGGIHYYFACDDPALTVGVEFAPGLDYRGNGGYVIAPPSVHKNGRTYEWEVNHTPTNCPLAPLPDWLHQLMLQGKEKDKPSNTKPVGSNEAPERVTEGSRNAEMFKLASSLRAKGLTVEEITAAMMEANKSRCDPPLSSREIETICRSAGRYERGEIKDSSPRPVLVKASEVPYEPPRWTIAPYFQRGKGTLIQGDNGSGKTAFMCAIAAHVTTGNPLLGIPIVTPGNVLALSVEDDLPVLRGRIEASGGDLEKCHFMTNAAGLTFNSPEVEAAIKQIGAKMVIFDPFQAFLGASVDMFRSNETRPELAKLFEMCERNDCSCAIIAHMGKSGDKSPVNRSLGSVDIPASMRSILQLTRNPDNEDECVMVHVKCSNAPRGQSIAYTIGDRGGVHWVGFSPMSIDDLTTITKRKEKGIPYDKEPLVQVFNQLITDKPGGGFWSYEDVKTIGMKLLGFPPFYSTNDLKQKLNSAFCRELQEKDGLIVTCGHKSNGSRGIRIEQYQVPDGYQTAINA